ncbi:MAG TPA: nitroreductase family protein [Methanospirillum sp.]|nr:nitroreductase family protein [Methanospirillum sp.]
MDLRGCIHTRYACKKFDENRLSEEQITELLELVRYAPSALNLQTWRVKIVVDPKIKAMIKPIAYDQEQILSCSHLLIFCADLDTTACINELETGMFRSGIPADTVAGFIGFVRNWFSSLPAGVSEEFAVRNTMIAASYAWLSAVSLGFDSCPMGGFDPVAIAQLLELPDHLKPVILTPVGYRADAPLPKYRHPVSRFII